MDEYKSTINKCKSIIYVELTNKRNMPQALIDIIYAMYYYEDDYRLPAEHAYRIKMEEIHRIQIYKEYLSKVQQYVSTYIKRVEYRFSFYANNSTHVLLTLIPKNERENYSNIKNILYYLDKLISYSNFYVYYRKYYKPRYIHTNIYSEIVFDAFEISWNNNDSLILWLPANY